jgi:hypothetical protein
MERFLLEVRTPLTPAKDEMMKIYFLLMIVSVFVAVSYIPVRPIRIERKQKSAAAADSAPA